MSKKGLGKFIVGAGIGAAIGLIFAPKKGSELRKDSYYAALGGACGVILFRWGLVNFFNFNDIH